MDKYYHGSDKKISRFVDDFVGGEGSNDQAGPGIYFTKDINQAESYGDHIHVVELNPKKEVSSEEGTYADENELLWLAKQSDEWEDSAGGWSKNPEKGVREAVSSALRYNDSQHEQFSQIWVDFYRYNAKGYVKGMSELGYDMSTVMFDVGGGDDIKNAIVFNPSIINPIDYFDKSEGVNEGFSKRVLSIIKEEIEEIMSDDIGVKAPVIRRTFGINSVPERGSEETDGDVEEVIEEAVKRFRVKRYDKNNGKITIIFPNGKSEYEYGNMSPFLYKKLKEFIKNNNNKAIQSLISKLDKLHENTMIRNYAGGLSLNDKYNNIPPGPVRAYDDITAGTAEVEDIEEDEEKED